MNLYRSLLICIVFLFSLKISAQTVCVGIECNSIPNEFQILTNFASPTLDQIYTERFLESMGEIAVLQNLNGRGSYGIKEDKLRIQGNYSAGIGTKTPSSFVYENSELRNLPRQGIAAAANLSVVFPMSKIFTASVFRRWDMGIFGFPYEFGEQNLPFLKIRNTEVSGRVYNYGIFLRYLPESNDFSFGFTLMQTNQDIYLNSYDRRPTQFRIDGIRRRWIGQNDLTYGSRITSLGFDIQYRWVFGFLTVLPGIGVVGNTGFTKIEATRFAAISSALNPDDFSTNPTAVGIRLASDFTQNSVFFYGSLNLVFQGETFGFSLDLSQGQTMTAFGVSLFARF